LVAVVKEDIAEEVAAFREAVWPNGDVFLDQDMSFYKALYNGQLVQANTFLVILFMLWTYISCGDRVWEKMGGNLKGEGLIQGGLMVVDKDGSILLQKQGDEISPEKVLQELLSKS